jgi:tRNA pseudouridine55 synthase
LNTTNSFEEGKVILIDKPLHWTSFDVIRRLRSIVKIKKIGHAGTLDPLATGLLIVCTGKFTKKINEFMAAEKEYTGTFTLGATTPTYDLESVPQEFKDISFITPQLLMETVKQFTGEISQVPPIHSAIKQEGKRVYLLARKGADIKLQARKVSIYDFELTNIELPVISFRLVCTTGTYVRSLAYDFGAALGCGAYLSSLRRTRIGLFTVDQSLSPDAFAEQLKLIRSDQNG